MAPNFRKHSQEKIGKPRSIFSGVQKMTFFGIKEIVETHFYFLIFHLSYYLGNKYCDQMWKSSFIAYKSINYVKQWLINDSLHSSRHGFVEGIFLCNLIDTLSWIHVFQPTMAPLSLRDTVCFFSNGTKENGISQPPDMLNTSAIAHSKGLSMAFMLYFQPKF